MSKKERLYAVQTVLKLDNRIINQNMLLFSAKDDETAQEFVKQELASLNKQTVTETIAVSIKPYPMELVVQSANGGKKTFVVKEK